MNGTIVYAMFLYIEAIMVWIGSIHYNVDENEDNYIKKHDPYYSTLFNIAMSFSIVASMTFLIGFFHFFHIVHYYDMEITALSVISNIVGQFLAFTGICLLLFDKEYVEDSSSFYEDPTIVLRHMSSIIGIGLGLIIMGILANVLL
jgi:hypothetical protein